MTTSKPASNIPPSAPATFVDIHCHLVPAIDDGAQTWQDTLSMAQIAVQSGTHTIVVTPHQLGNFRKNTGDVIRGRTRQLQQFLEQHQIPLRVLPGGDVRIEEDMVAGIADGSVMTLADHRKHVLLELPHEIYFPIESIIDELQSLGIQGILSHPERNMGLLAKPELLAPLVDRNCLMQVTCGSLVGTFGEASQRMAEFMLQEGLVHFLASDGHSPKRRRPHMHRGFQRAVEIVGEALATEMCSGNPGRVAAGHFVDPGRRTTVAPLDRSSAEKKAGKRIMGGMGGWLSRRRAA